MELAFLHHHMEVDMYIECLEGIMDLGIITKEFLEEYCILLGKSMYGNIDAEILWIRLLDQYLVNEYNIKRSKVGSCRLFRKYYQKKL